MTTRRCLLVLPALLLASCAMSSESTIPAANVRVCTLPTGALRTILYITPADDPRHCVVVDGGAALNVSPCDELGWTRDGTRTLVEGVRLEDVVATAEGRLQERTSERGAYTDYDFRVTLVPASGPTRVVHALGTFGPYAAPESGCYLTTPPSP